MLDISTRMRAEIGEIPQAVERVLSKSADAIERAADALGKRDPRFICTAARGSSDHAATYLKYAIELASGIPVASIGPSVCSIYGARLRLSGSACIAISQSGRSPDIASVVRSAKTQGALTIAITNDPQSPLAGESDHILDIQAGREESVAATKTFVTSVVSSLMLLGHWTKDGKLLESLAQLPEMTAAAIGCDWGILADQLPEAASLYVLGRGPSFAIANEVALKFKETCQIQAEAFSSAEVLHGPVSMVAPNYPVLALVSRDKSQNSILAVADDLAVKGADVFVTADSAEHARRLPFIATGHPLTDPLMLAVSFYAFVEKLARLRGLNPDEPRNLKKVTRTV